RVNEVSLFEDATFDDNVFGQVRLQSVKHAADFGVQLERVRGRLFLHCQYDCGATFDAAIGFDANASIAAFDGSTELDIGHFLDQDGAIASPQHGSVFNIFER